MWRVGVESFVQYLLPSGLSWHDAFYLQRVVVIAASVGALELDSAVMSMGARSGPTHMSGSRLSISQLYAHFVQRVRRNLHIVLCFSPLGDNLRTCLRQFPAMVSCCQYVADISAVTIWNVGVHRSETYRCVVVLVVRVPA